MFAFAGFGKRIIRYLGVRELHTEFIAQSRLQPI